MSGDWRDSDEVRPFFGEESQPVGTSPVWTPTPPVYAASPQRRERDRLAEGKCGRDGCGGLVAEDFEEGCCRVCGWSLTEYEMSLRLARVEDKPDYAPTLSTLFAHDEYGPADVTEDAA